ncbi:MAG: hypothetical protein Q8N59_02370 [bacterium]|nr:hypothetical protein [bacterium]
MQRGFEVPRAEKAIDDANRIKKALKHAEEIYETNANIIKESDFEDLYSKEVIDRDLEWVRKEEERFDEEDTPEQKEARKISTVFEAIIYDQAEMSDWLGASAMTVKSSRYDDIKNGIDLIVEFPDNEEASASHLALAVDITLSSELEKKMSGIKRNIEQGNLSTIKYFKSETLNIRGEKKDVPKVVIGADSKMLDRVIDLWMTKTGDSKDELGKHPIQFVILEEILMQLEEFKDYAERIGQSNVSENYGKVIETIRDIYREKIKLREKILGDNDTVIKNDKVYRAIKSHLDRLSAQKSPRR